MKNMHIHRLSFSFSEDSPQFFKDVTIEISPKKLCFLRGANGSGKSTLFRLLQGHVHAGEILEGTVTIDGQCYDLTTKESRQKLQSIVQTVQQDYSSMIADQFNFEQNLRFARLPKFPTLKSLPAYTSIPELLKRFNVDMHTPVHLLSGGQRQILAILMALQKQPKLLLLDEPTAALDPVNTESVLAFLHELIQQTDIMILIITHDMSVVKQYAHDAYFEICIDQQTGTRTILACG